jgi:hypothetical protein
MKTTSLSSLDGLTDIGLRGGVDMRPTLIRVLTDLYVQKLSHTPDEEQHYTELALRLLEAVDVPTRASVAARLARHLSPPIRVIQFLAGDLPEVASALQPQPAAQPSAPIVPAFAPAIPAIVEVTALNHILDQSSDETESENVVPADAVDAMGPDIAGELNELFFAANANERRLILLNLDIVAPVPAGHAGILSDAEVGQRLETTALARNNEGFAQHLARVLRISRAQAQRIVSDELGEPIVVAAKSLNISRDVLYRILLFINTSVGHSVERVHALAELYDELSSRAAEDMIAIWQALRNDERPVARHQPVHWDDETRTRARPNLATAQRAPATSRRNERRDAS